MKEIVLFASGSGSNVENIIKYFQGNESIEVTCVLTNRSSAPVLERCKRLAIPALVFNREAFSKEVVLELLKSLSPDLIILAGFLWKIPPGYIRTFPNKIINIHPALLPKYGGKGMFGMHVHEAVKENNETETGITIHYVNENYDEGAIIFQTTVSLNKLDTPNTIGQKVQSLEYQHFPRVIEQLLQENG